MSFPPHASYKDSGVRWLGEVPSHWTVAPLKREYRIVGGATPKSEVEEYWDGDLPWVTPADLGKGDDWFVSETQRSITEAGLASCAAELVPAGAVILSTRAPIGSLGISTKPTCTNQGCKSLVARHACDPKLLAYALSAATAELNVRGRGTTFLELSGDELARFVLAWPPSDEQRAIADFLDRETAKIDALVEAQRRLIALLKEKRQAVISHAVTKGLDPSAPLKPSGVEWLGDVPAHWEVKKLRSLARLESGHTPSRQRPEYWVEDECVIPWFTLADVGALRSGEMMEVADTSQRISELGMENSAARLLPPGTVMLSRTASVGFSAITSIPLAVSQDFAAWICGPELRPSYLLLVLRAMNMEFQRLMMGSTHQTIYMPDIEAFRIPLPSLAEQDAIIAAASRKKAAVESLTREALSSEAILTERRAALISAAVTGKIDARGWTAKQVRNAVGAEIVHLHARDRTFGRVQNQKLLFLAQHHAQVEEIGGRFQRKAAGPHDADLMVSIEQALIAEGVLQVAQAGGPGSQVTYIVAPGTRPDGSRLRAMLGDQRLAKLNHMLEVLADEDTRGVEAVATLYGVWNDALLDGETPDDDRLIRGFMDWHPEKASKFKADDVRNRIGFMRRNGLVPEGRGSRTQVGALL